MKNLLCILLSVLCFWGCSEQTKNTKLDKDEAMHIMQDVSRRNLAYVPLTEHDNTLMQQVVEYYRLHGTSNELMEAYYLLGSVYRELHEAPKAMNAFLQGISTADTLDADCRYDLLTRLYAQKSEMLYKQNLYVQAINEEKHVAHFALKARDTLYYVNSLWTELGMYYSLKDFVTMTRKTDSLLIESKRYGCFEYVASLLVPSVLANLEIDNLEDAERLLDIYERYGGDVDMKTLESSFPMYYYAKGRLMAARQKEDSAELFFRKQLIAHDWNNRQAAYRGLRGVFEDIGKLDSAFWYAKLQCEAVDSEYQEKVATEIQNLEKLYDYSRIQNANHQKELQLKEEKRKKDVIVSIAVVMGILVMWVFSYMVTRYRQRIAKAELELEQAVRELMEKESFLMELREKKERNENTFDKSQLREELVEAEQDAKRQRELVLEKQQELDVLRKQASFVSKSIRQQYHGKEMFLYLLQKVKEEHIATAEDYQSVEMLLKERDSALISRIYEKIPSLSDTERNVILLLRMGLTKTEVSVLTAHTQSAVSNTINRLFQKCVGRKAMNSAESYNWLMTI